MQAETETAQTSYLTSADVAKMLSRARRTVDDWRYRGEGPPYVRLYGRVLYPLDELNQWIAETAEHVDPAAS